MRFFFAFCFLFNAHVRFLLLRVSQFFFTVLVVNTVYCRTFARTLLPSGFLALLCVGSRRKNLELIYVWSL